MMSQSAMEFDVAGKYFRQAAMSGKSEAWLPSVKAFVSMKLQSEAIRTCRLAVLKYGAMNPHLVSIGHHLLMEQQQPEEARMFLEQAFATGSGILHSPWQYPSLLLRGLEWRSQAWWDTTNLRAAQVLKASFNHIKEEYHSAQSSGLLDTLMHAEPVVATQGEWTQLTLHIKGMHQEHACLVMPYTCKLITSLPEAASCPWGQIYISVLSPGTKVTPHVGPTNARLRIHLGLDVPKGDITQIGMRVGGDVPGQPNKAHHVRSWVEGECLAFEDSFEHEVWQHTEDLRVILVMDVWHPSLNDVQRAAVVEEHGDAMAKHAYFHHRANYLADENWFGSSADVPLGCGAGGPCALANHTEL